MHEKSPQSFLHKCQAQHFHSEIRPRCQTCTSVPPHLRLKAHVLVTILNVNNTQNRVLWTFFQKASLTVESHPSAKAHPTNSQNIINKTRQNHVFRHLQQFLFFSFFFLTVDIALGFELTVTLLNHYNDHLMKNSALWLYNHNQSDVSGDPTCVVVEK